MNRLENMETFVRVVEAGSISAAAERLGVAKSAVSRRLKELETHLGVELFHRTTRRMNLTDTGRSFYQQCLRLLDDVLEAELAASQAHATLAGRLKVAMPSSFGLMHMSSAINDFLKANPSIEFDLDFNDREVDLIQEGFDLAIRIGRLPDSSLIARRLAPIRLILCASPGYLEKHGTPQTPQELTAHDCLVYSLNQDPDHWLLPDNKGNGQRIKIRPRLRASTGEFLRDAAVADRGIILLPSFIAYREIEQGSLQPILCDYQPENLDAFAIYPPTRHLSQRVRAFVDFLAERFAGVPYWDRCLQNT
ncbi:MAG TPA: LysR family transcriptional regulator [Gammaproteobacteria bacterium]|nr:LysR family transcriptional regulator [Gammaproteobacteria bacterium]